MVGPVYNPGFVSNYWNTWNETDKTPCAWDGVICTNRSTVEQLYLEFLYLTRLPSLGVLSNLRDLRVLALLSNVFGSPNGPEISIPDDIGSLVGLTYLYLSSNAFSGPIPRTISSCRSLVILDLQSNALTGEIPDLSGLHNLEDLDLSYNQFRGPFPKWLGELNRLAFIDLSFNMFDGTIPSLSNLTRLSSLTLDNNTFSGFEVPIFPGASSSLSSLTVSSNRLEGSIPPSITKLTSLVSFDMSCNQLSGHIPSGFSLQMNTHSQFDLSQNELTGNIPDSLLQSNRMDSYGPVTELNLSYNLLTGHIPFDATKGYNYDILDFSHNNLSGPIPSICSNWTGSFKYFWLQNNRLSGDIVDFLAQCHGAIMYLRLANNFFSGDLSRMININTSLNLVMDALSPKVLDLSNNNLGMSTTAANPDPMRALFKIFFLNTSLTEFRMRGNNFVGARLPAYCLLASNSLQVLDLRNNHLGGEISSAAFNSTWVPALKFLYLSGNEITGLIPEAVVMIPNLVVLDVANNNLFGPLPAILPRALYNSSFFAGNGGLCGGPLRDCPQSTGVPWWVFFIVVGGSSVIAAGSCMLVMWRWRVYHKMHQQDADLIRTLLERESASLMSLRELKKATDNFAEHTRIGEGGFATVYIGKLNDGTVVAIKRSKREGSEKEKEEFLNEVRILSQVKHRHLVKLLGCCMENKSALLVFELVSNGTLQEHLRGKVGGACLNWKQRLHIAVQTADALNYLHSATTSPIYHRDVKSANILLDEDLNAKVADFGISMLAPLEGTHVSTPAVQGTIGYIDPEYYNSYQLTDKSDVYSFGVVLLELISAKPPIDFGRGGEETSLVNFAKREIASGDLLRLIDKTLLDTYNDLASHGRDSILNVGRLAMKCLQMRSKVRPSMHEVWKELQNIMAQDTWYIQGLADAFFDETNHEDPRHIHIGLLSDCFSSSSSSVLLPKYSTQ